jgi:hypothetical protein
MSGERPAQDDPPPGAPEKPQRRAQAPAGGRRAHIVGDLLLIVGAFVLASALAGALGAANLGTALSFGQIGLAMMVVYVLLRR